MQYHNYFVLQLILGQLTMLVSSSLMFRPLFVFTRRGTMNSVGEMSAKKESPGPQPINHNQQFKVVKTYDTMVSCIISLMQHCVIIIVLLLRLQIGKVKCQFLPLPLSVDLFFVFILLQALINITLLRIRAINIYSFNSANCN